MTIVFKEVEKMNRLHGKAGRVVTSWNQFAVNVKEAINLYVTEKQNEFYSSLDDLVKQVRKALPLKFSLLAFSPFLTYLILYSNYKRIRYMTGLDELRKPNLTFLPWLEYTLFHFYPHRFLSKFATPVLDFLAAIPYLIHFPLPALFLIFLVLSENRRKCVFPFMWCAGWVNLVTCITQLIFPTAPPWFVDSAVFDNEGNFIKSTANEAGFHRLDALLGHNVFHGIYSASPLKFGAFPSLHVAWPAIILVNEPWVGKRFAWMHVVWIAWAAMYSNHHYLVDVLGGILLVFIVNFSMIKIWSPFHQQSQLRDLLRRFMTSKRTTSKDFSVVRQL